MLDKEDGSLIGLTFTVITIKGNNYPSASNLVTGQKKKLTF
jgi:hypothetical protein